MSDVVPLPVDRGNTGCSIGRADVADRARDGVMNGVPSGSIPKQGEAQHKRQKLRQRRRRQQQQQMCSAAVLSLTSLGSG